MKALIMSLFITLSSLQAKDNKIDPLLKDYRFEDELQGKDNSTDIRWGFENNYSFISLIAGEQRNSFSSEVNSELSPGLGIFSELVVTKTLVFGARFNYTRAVFASSKVNLLAESAVNLYEIDFYLNKNLNERLSLYGSVGQSSQAYLASVENGVAQIDALNRYVADLKLKLQFFKSLNWNASVYAGARFNFNTKKDLVQIESNIEKVVGLELGHVNTQSYNMRLEYSSSDIVVDEFEQEFKQLKFVFQIAFGEIR